MADTFLNLATGVAGTIDPSGLVHAGAGVFQIIQAQRQKAKGPSTGHSCDSCKKEIYTKTDRYRCLGCSDYDSCQKCFPKLHHPRHAFVRVPAAGNGEIEVVLNGMPHWICDGCGNGWGGLHWMCAECTGSAVAFCHSCFPLRYQKHPIHTSYVRYFSMHYPSVSFPLSCKACNGPVRNSLWDCSHCPDTVVCQNPGCYSWLQGHAPGHWKFDNCTLIA
ncbi:hypothetical protein PUNSTDRAFT_122448 [Punctularia strigosozonata HHB-11173 SS5]|uniref:ZZ-type domain-containing protein n=1 Tax=Punctularia strigosozonata (strain HHB-11173) TaxID=741275 RepID=R7S4A8_PUNST|nr:uncharacterized protein PUNSTDRAFT_122448 [Punctularia strigosozonata HHB-11173 SS5]EIN05058.1 hypothetical protein PUNSTDRAFT_122448 [Punctularia strigosozonata HHB-11173 SS5]